ncbi:MAG TPA: 3-hydroxyacyl-ACP dehydratase FabZ [Planctomycetota bacterium]|nr:3-hydroxyacyl-ACP dehydratase FabZ [Planctomycetota bacterium]
MGIEEIKKFLPHRYPFLLVDRVTELEPGRKIVGFKNISINEPQFTGHFPDMSVFPGVLQIEAMSQLAGILVYKWLEDPDNSKSKHLPTAQNTLPMLAGVDDARFRRKVVPGDQMVMEIITEKCRVPLFSCHGRCLVNGEVASEADMKYYLVEQARDAE